MTARPLLEAHNKLFSLFQQTQSFMQASLSLQSIQARHCLFLRIIWVQRCPIRDCRTSTPHAAQEAAAAHLKYIVAQATLSTPYHWL